MKKILVITHGTFALGIKESIKVIMGDNSMIDTICVTESCSPAEIKGKIAEYMESVLKDIPVIALTDIPGGSTTASIAPFLLNYTNLYVVSGLNLAIMLAVAIQAVEEGDIKENIRKIIDDAKTTMLFVNDVFSGNSSI
ncbi:MAG: PTS sugar transporter subunit IIA [Anaerorhabdus sp.]